MFQNNCTVIWLKYFRYGVNHYTINKLFKITNNVICSWTCVHWPVAWNEELGCQAPDASDPDDFSHDACRNRHSTRYTARNGYLAVLDLLWSLFPVFDIHHHLGQFYPYVLKLQKLVSLKITKAISKNLIMLNKKYSGLIIIMMYCKVH